MPKQKYKRRKDGRYTASISVGKLPNGNIKRKYVYATSPTELDKKLTDLKMNYYKGTISEDSITFKMWAEKWYQLNIENKEIATQKSNRSLLDNYLIPFLGGIKLKELKPYHIKEMINNMVEKGLTDRTKRALSTTKRILNDAIENNVIYSNPAFNIKTPKFSKNEKRPLTKEEDHILYEVAQNHKYGLFFLMLRYCGLRTEEAVALTKQDIDLNNKIIKINKAVSLADNQPVLKATKNLKGRKVPIPDILIEPIESIMDSPSKYVFYKQTNNNEMLSKTAVKNMCNSFLYSCNQYSKIHFTPHQLRHSYCTMLYYAGVKIKKAQELMGHSSADMVYDVYTHLDEERENADKIINNYINNAVKM